MPSHAGKSFPSRSNAGHSTSPVASSASSHMGDQQHRCPLVLLHKRQPAPFVVSLNMGLSDSDQSTSSFHQSDTDQGGYSSPTQRLETTTFSLPESNANNLAACIHLTGSGSTVPYQKDMANGVASISDLTLATELHLHRFPTKSPWQETGA